MNDPRDPKARADARSAWPVRVYALGAEPPDDLRSSSTPEERIAMVAALSAEAFSLAGRAPPTYARADAPVVRRRLGE